MGGRFVHPRWAGSLRARMVCHCLLVELSDRLVLVDTALGEQDIRRPARRLGGAFAWAMHLDEAGTVSATEQIRGLGFDPKDVRDIVLTHLDLDHAGGIVDFPHARIHVMAEEHRVGIGRLGRFGRLRFKPAMWAHEPKWVLHDNVDGDTWHGFASVRAFNDDLLLIPLAGHTLGHMGVAVRDDARGWLLHGGDAFFFHGQVGESPAVPAGLAAFQWILAQDREAERSNRARLRELALGGQAQVFCAHDPDDFQRFQT